MRITPNRAAMLLGAVAVLGVACVSNAAMIEVATFHDVSPGQDVSIHITNRYFVSPVVSDVGTRAGQFNWTGVDAGNPSALAGNFTTFCIDFSQDVVYGGTYTYAVESLENGARPNAPGDGNPTGGSGASLGLGTDRSKATLIRQLWAHYYDGTANDADAAAAFQLTIWKLLYETDATAYTDLTRGDFQVTGGSLAAPYVTEADAYLAFLADPANESAPQQSNLVALTSDTAQDQITVVPEPAAIGGLAAPAGLLLARRRKRE